MTVYFLLQETCDQLLHGFVECLDSDDMEEDVVPDQGDETGKYGCIIRKKSFVFMVLSVEMYEILDQIPYECK